MPHHGATEGTRKDSAAMEARFAVLRRAVDRLQTVRVGKAGRTERGDRRTGGHGLQDVQEAAGATWTGTGWTGVPVGRLAGLVDAEFERDARRYDGPLGLLG